MAVVSMRQVGRSVNAMRIGETAGRLVQRQLQRVCMRKLKVGHAMFGDRMADLIEDLVLSVKP